MANETLQLLAREIRGKTLRILDGVTDEQSRFVPHGLNNSIVWHAGHSLWVVEVLSVAAATGKAAPLPDGWTDLFNSKSRPTPQTKFPPLAQVIEALRSQLDRLTKAIEPLTPQQLAVIVDSARNRSVRYNILHGLHDEANHGGEMWLLRKMQNANAR